VFRAGTDLFGPSGTSCYHLETGPTLGLGFQYEMTRSFALRGEWQTYGSAVASDASPSSTVHRVGLGVLWRVR